jgi:molybdopterin molybdotransferase
MSTPHRVDVATAAALIADHMPSYPSVPLPLDDCTGAILRQIVRAERDQPPFDRVTMDGIAIRHAGFAAGCRDFFVRGTQGAGGRELELGADDACIEIMTGAALPADADTIIPVERIRRAGDRALVEAGYEPAAGQFVHRRASDHASGQVLLTPGQRIGPAEMAVLTIGGSPTVQVAQWPAISVISTGSELVDVGAPLQPGQIRSSNDRALAAALKTRGARRVSRSRLPDELDALRREIAQLHAAHNVLVLSGGVSMGKYDYVPRILSELGVKLVFHKILQRPGLPMWFGVSEDGKPVFALPGNPVSSLVCLVRYVIPALEMALGLEAGEPPPVPLASAVEFEPDLTWFLPVVLQHAADGSAQAVPKPTNTSGDFISLAGTTGFVELPRGHDEYPAGFPARLYRW